ncbi:tetratricopeptide repeat protein [Streptomyces caniscabiei]|uniref:tetratricopeptide repeat protein n=1 Tax=Streptomyces caniscabiei TaxID=2746961 RepID=UPI0029AC077D|nr:tetratricopeptide repeat protein [Streptomyces caniscabiei]MDX2598975.1 tetratricopeptide repeat protein [Streptomyces caniscabiei]MDX2736445.1 tetratricopeptide repeat protein [Streptomyces caniscabiei]MDX2781320.1 tetratricopeptide repeat protein [Streptomyces caniscabiei]
MRKSEAKGLIQQAYEAWDAEEWQRAADLYEQVLAHFPDEGPSAEWWYDAALGHKFLRNWDKAYELGVQAAARAPRGEGDPAFWNLGIAATIRRDWAVARDAWAGFGLDVPAGEGAIEGRFGHACVRLDTDGEREVVWIERLCPTRGRVVNVPVTGGRRYGEIVLHDGQPNGERVVDGTTFPVFDELLLFEASDLPTLRVTVAVGESADLEALVALFADHDFGAETADSLTVHCACCSEGTIHKEHTQTRTGAQCLRLAAPEEDARRLLDLWAGEKAIGRSWSGLEIMG